MKSTRKEKSQTENRGSTCLRNVTLRCVRATTVAVEKQSVLHNQSVFVCVFVGVCVSVFVCVCVFVCVSVFV